MRARAATVTAAALGLLGLHAPGAAAAELDSVRVNLSGVTATATGSAATIRFRTSITTRATVRVGVDGTYGLVVAPKRPARDHRVVLDGLRPATRYVFRVEARDGSATGSFTTSPYAASPVAAVQGGVVRVDGSPFFPLISWAQCAATVEDSLALGVNVFMSSCDDPLSLAAAVGGRAYVVPALGTPVVATGVLGSHQPDEPEGYGIPPSALQEPPATGGHLHDPHAALRTPRRPAARGERSSTRHTSRRRM